MAARQVLAFVVGVLLSSAWWSLAALPTTSGGWEWLLPALATIASVVVVFIFFIEHWDD